MARTPKKIAAKAEAAWRAGDELLASKLSGLQSRQLRNRLGPPGRTVAPSVVSLPVTAPSAPTPQKLVQVKPQRVATAPSPPVVAVAPEPPPSQPDPTVEQIEAIDTREEAEALYRELRSRMATADEVRYGALAERSLAALNRIEQIDARRPKPPARDEVTRRIVEVRDAAIARVGLLTSDRAARFASDVEAFGVWCATLGPFGTEVKARVDALLGRAA